MPDILKQIWRLLRIAATGPGSKVSFVLLAIIVACQLGGIQITIRLVQWSADFFNALQKLDVPTVLNQVGVFALLTGASAGLYLIGQYLRKILQIRWRKRLTDVLLDRWTAKKAYWFLHPSLGRNSGIDNPDQRIAEDCNLFVESILGTSGGSRSGVLDFLMSLIALVSYVTLLWQLSTFPLAFSAFGYDVEIPKYMVWIAPIYVAVATGITHFLGHSLPALLAEEQKREANFRYALINVRENAASIALSKGEAAERRVLAGRFDDISNIWHRVIRREFIYGLFQRPYFQSVLRIPMFIALPAFLAGKVTLGGLMQVAQAFTNVVTTLSWFIFNYKFLSDLAATTRRLQRLFEAIGASDAAPPSIAVAANQNARILDISELELSSPDGRKLLGIDNVAIEKGDVVWLSGASGLGKSTLIKSIAGLWTRGNGTVKLPDGNICFLPQQVYLPLMSLAEAVCYPNEATPERLQRARSLLVEVGLGHRLAQDQTSGLSVGEQQRLAIARAIASEPDWLILDEAMSALDIPSERALMTMLKEHLPNTTLIIIAHREPQGVTQLRKVVLDTPHLQQAAV